MKIRKYFTFSAKRSGIAFVCFVVLFILSVSVLNFPLHGEKNLRTEVTGSNREPVGYISDNHIVVQSLFFHKPVVLHSMEVLAANYGNAVTMPELHYSVRDNRKQVIFSSSVSTSEIQDNQNLHLELGDVRLRANQRYFIYFQGPVADESVVCPTFWTMDKNDISDTLYRDTGKWLEGRALNATYSYDVVPMGMGVWLCYLLLLAVFLAAANVKPEKIRNNRLRIPAMLWCFFWGGMLLSIVLFQDAVNELLFRNSYAVLFCIGMIVTLACAAILFVRTDFMEWLVPVWNWIKKHRIFIGISYFVLLFATQYIIASNIYQKIGWDVSYVWDIVTEWMTEEHASASSYIQLYPNNIGLCLLFYFLRSFVAHADMAAQYWFVVVVNILAIDFGIFLCYRLARRMFGFGSGVCAVLLLSVLYGLSGHIIVPYTDNFTFFIPAAILYLYFVIRDYRKNTAVQISCSAGLAFLLVWGYHLKPQCIIMGMAIVLVEGISCIVRRIKRIPWRPAQVLRAFRFALPAFVVGIAISFGSFYYCQSRMLPEGYTDEASMPMTHFFMMGLNENPESLVLGGFCYQDVDISTGAYATKDKIAKNKEIIGERLHEFGFGGFLNHAYRKAINILGDGTFFWQIEGGFYEEDYSKKENSSFQENLREKYYGRYGEYEDEKLQLFLSRLSGIWFAILFFVMIPCGKRGRTGKRAAFAGFAILGALAFTILFEGRSRYLANYLPLFAVLASGGMLRFCRGIQRRLGV